MKFILSICFFLYVFSTSSCFKWTDCGGTALRFLSYKLLPDPIVYPGNIITGGDIEYLRDDLPSNSSLKLKILFKKLIGGKLLAIPCLKGMGSCTYDYCDETPSLKDIFFKSFKATCPLHKKHYTAKEETTTLPKFGEKLFEDLLDGHFEGRVTLLNDESKEMYGCLDFKLDIRVKH